MLELLRILAQGGSPSLLVRILLDHDHYRARLSGDVPDFFSGQPFVGGHFYRNSVVVVVVHCMISTLFSIAIKSRSNVIRIPRLVIT